ncbi:hypothetical protein AKJ51_04710 [candidate division MSBL1 archaeon SCGC-AAA382A20]|uniref:Uncharacterized protein n=1 Tax=candidate division MSBL1 archaeon SCGC-AAA382A20 TaxID=1698280 RepID=A0A133VHB7_9EURY|nr:hypothetical protein AKJ51_04710 [candidate division MSBL1 archaeon SCGC-AAA382A20]
MDSSKVRVSLFVSGDSSSPCLCLSCIVSSRGVILTPLDVGLHTSSCSKESGADPGATLGRPNSFPFEAVEANDKAPLFFLNRKFVFPYPGVSVGCPGVNNQNKKLLPRGGGGI